MTYYDVLGVPPNASDEEIKRAYRVQIKFFHPDVFTENPEIARIKTLQLNEAYAVLKDPIKRRFYDLTINPQPQAQKPPPPPPTANCGTTSPPPRKPPHVEPPPVREEDVSNRSWGILAVVLICLAVVASIWGIVKDGLSASTLSAASPSVSHYVTVYSPSTLPFYSPIPTHSYEIPTPSPYYAIHPPYATSTPSSPSPSDLPARLFFSPPVVFSGEIIHYPDNEGVAPLTVETPSGHNYYICLKSLDGEKSNEMSFYITGGNTEEVLVPLGEYAVYYATGDTWYGTEYLFWEDTSYYKCDDTFYFYEEDYTYYGYTLTLSRVYNGNLDTDTISADEFPSLG